MSAPEDGSSASAGPGASAASQPVEGAAGGPSQRAKAKAKQKRYHRHPKPPYTYLAMIALVIRAAPERRLKLSQIIKEISTLFPFFKEGYQGWKDSIRHNLSSNDCFHKVLKDPAKPKAKGNFWTVDVDRIPPEALKLQNTPVSRQEERTFVVDLAPYVYHGWPFSCSQAPHNTSASDGSSGLTGEGAPQNTPFSIDSLLSDFQDVGLGGKPRAGAEAPHTPTAALDFWGPVPIFRVSSGPPLLPWRPSGPLPALRSFSSSSSLSSHGSSSPKGREAGRRHPKKVQSRHALAKRPRVHQAPESSGSDSGDDTPPPLPPPAPHWEQLPTSYSKCVAPNVVAPSSPFSAFSAVPGQPFYGPMPSGSPLSWELMPGPSIQPSPPPRLPLELDQTMPPNKTVFDVWMTHPLDIIQPAFAGAGLCPRRAVLTHYDPS
ncbi:forkhead box protein H1 [Eublepharis macularius]|uniref:Forkhead box protein H1 n=1 Tax=Eublepharis macularius TaxID=481883 RepID=A0AA97L4M5_EUBMA|nr:forkhead box protein H1 [Eublepharis macularius]